MNLFRKILSFGQSPSRERLHYTPIGGETKYYYDPIDMSIEVGDMIELNDLGVQYEHLVKSLPKPAKVIGIQENTGKYSGYRHITVDNPEGEFHSFYNNVIKKHTEDSGI